MVWYLQIQDINGEVLLLNRAVGTFTKFSKRIDNATDKIVANFPTAWRWEVRPKPYDRKVIL